MTEIRDIHDLLARRTRDGLDLRGVSHLPADLAATLGFTARFAPLPFLVDGGSQPDRKLVSLFTPEHYRTQDDRSGLLPHEWRMVLDLRPQELRG